MSILTDLFGIGQDGGASDYQKQALDQFKNIAPPDPEQMKIQLQQMVQQGTITPEQAQSFTVNNNAYNDINVNPAYRNAQEGALGGYQQIANQGGMTAEDTAQLRDIQNQAQTAERGSREAITQNMAERGLGGSGVDLASKLANEQGSASRQSQADLDVAAQAQQRKMSALGNIANLGGQMQSQAYGEQANKAGAANQIANFNAANQTNVGLQNTAANNTAQYSNLANKQNIANTNVNTANQQEQYNKQLPQLNYQNQMGKATAMQGGYNNLSNIAQNNQNKKDAFTGALIGAGAQVAAPWVAPVKKAVDATQNQYWKGGIVGGIPKVKGNSPINDTVDAKLSPGEMVIPRTAVQKIAGPVAPNTPHPHDMAAMLSALAHLRANKKSGKVAPIRGI